jgi:hypothetical protein
MTKVFTLFLLLTTLIAAAQVKDFQSELKRGSFSVGFRKRYINDYSHQYSATQKPGEPFYRPLMVNVWYPTESVLINKKVTISACISYHNKKDSRSDVFFTSLKRHYKNEILNHLYPLQDTAAKRAQMGFLSFYYIAAEDLPPIPDKKFPVILYHPNAGVGAMENTVLCEFLASHGFVVITSCFLPSDLKDLSSASGNALSLSDIAAMLPALVKDNFIDWENMAFLGYKTGADAGIAALSQPGHNYKSAFYIFPGEKVKPNQSIPQMIISGEKILSQTNFTSLLCTQINPPLSSFSLLKEYYLQKAGVAQWKSQLKNYHYFCDLALLFFKASLQKDEVSKNILLQKNAVLKESIFSWQENSSAE